MRISRQGFDLLTQCFEIVAAQQGRTFQQYLLSVWAHSHGLPRGEMRRLYRIWVSERAALLVGGEADA